MGVLNEKRCKNKEFLHLAYLNPQKYNVLEYFRQKENHILTLNKEIIYQDNYKFNYSIKLECSQDYLHDESKIKYFINHYNFQYKDIPFIQS